jgi:hypothetical protein
MEMSQINEFEDLLEHLIKFSNSMSYKRVGRREVFDALFVMLTDKDNLEWIGDLWDSKLSKAQAEALLRDFDFDALKKTIEVDEYIFRKHFLYKKKVRIKSKGLIWIIHKNDKDPFPSNPHAHNLDQNIKLDLSNGNYFRNRKLLDKLSKKDFLEIREKVSKVYDGDLPMISI